MVCTIYFPMLVFLLKRLVFTSITYEIFFARIFHRILIPSDSLGYSSLTQLTEQQVSTSPLFKSQAEVIWKTLESVLNSFNAAADIAITLGVIFFNV